MEFNERGVTPEYESTNINTLWVKNILENIKNLEQMERLAREACNSLMEYLQVPIQQRNVILADTQYKNLKFMVSEMLLLLTDLVPVVDKKFHDDMEKNLLRLESVINNRSLFLEEPVNNRDKTIITSKLKPEFERVLRIIASLRKNIIREIAPLLFVKSEVRQEPSELSLVNVNA